MGCLNHGHLRKQAMPTTSRRAQTHDDDAVNLPDRGREQFLPSGRSSGRIVPVTEIDIPSRDIKVVNARYLFFLLLIFQLGIRILPVLLLLLRSDMNAIRRH